MRASSATRPSFTTENTRPLWALSSGRRCRSCFIVEEGIMDLPVHQRPILLPLLEDSQDGPQKGLLGPADLVPLLCPFDGQSWRMHARLLPAVFHQKPMAFFRVGRDD